MKFRVKYLPAIGYWAQAKTGLFSGWRTVGKHSEGYGFYPEHHIQHPLSNIKEVEQRISDFANWHHCVKDEPIYYQIKQVGKTQNH